MSSGQLSFCMCLRSKICPSTEAFQVCYIHLVPHTLDKLNPLLYQEEKVKGFLLCSTQRSFEEKYIRSDSWVLWSLLSITLPCWRFKNENSNLNSSPDIVSHTHILCTDISAIFRLQVYIPCFCQWSTVITFQKGHQVIDCFLSCAPYFWCMHASRFLLEQTQSKFFCE